MRVFILFLWLLALAARPLAVQAQPQCPTSPNPPCGGAPFQAYLVAPGDPNNGREVQRFCVGSTYRFAPCSLRTDINANTQVLYSSGPLIVPGCVAQAYFTVAAPFRPTAIGTVTITETANNAGQPATLYRRTFDVLETSRPTFTLDPCPAGNARLRLTDPVNTEFFTVIGNVRRRLTTRDTVLTLPTGTASFTLIGRVAGSLCEGQATVTVPAIATPPPVPVFSSLTLAGSLPGPATLAVSNLPDYYRYTLVRADGSAPGGFAFVANVLPGATTVPVTLPGPGCYRLRRADFCGTDSVLSAATLCALPLVGQALPGQNLLTFDYSGTTQNLTLFRNGTVLTTLPSGTTSYPDNAVVCGTRYNYRLQANVAPGAVSISNDLDLLATTGVVPPAPTLRASFNLRNVVELTATLPGGAAVPPGSTLRYARSSGGGPTTDLAAVPVTAGVALQPGRDSTALSALLAAPPCYTARLVDVCNQSSPRSPDVCPALLTARPDAADPARVGLSYTPLQSPGGPFSYTLLVLATDGSELRRQAVSNGAATDTSPLTDPQRLRYRLEITGSGLVTPSYSNLADVARPLRLAIPTAFTPNGDGLNDVLELKGRYLDKFTFIVVDRNGQEVFRAADRSTAWDGRINGSAPVNGTYVWRFTQTDASGEMQTQTGTVTIVN